DHRLCGLSTLASRARAIYARALKAIREEDANETSPPRISALGRRRRCAACRVAHREGANSSVAPDHDGRAIPAGGLTDVIGRILAEGMRTSLGQSVIIEAASVPAGSPARRPTDTLWWSAFGTRTSRTALPMRSSTTS